MPKPFSWPESIEEATEIQSKLITEYVPESPFKSITDIKTVTGIDVHFSEDQQQVFVGITTLSLPELKVIENLTETIDNEWYFPYISTFLSFREIPPILKVIEKLKIDPDVVVCNGHGIIHPRKMGLATHLGILLNKPTVGCASRLVKGFYYTELPPPDLEGGYTLIKVQISPSFSSPLMEEVEDPPWRDLGEGESTVSKVKDTVTIPSTLVGESEGEGGIMGTNIIAEEIVGVVLRTKRKVNPVFVSPGNKMGVIMAKDIIMNCCRKDETGKGKFRLPEPIRLSHQSAKPK